MTHYDYIIIGSGPSGGTLAYNLVNGGAKVLMLEAGPFYRKDTFPANEADYTAQLYWGGGIEFDVFAKTAFLRAKCVGGTSIVNQALLDRFDEMAFEDWRDRSGVSFFTEEEMRPHYDEVESNLSLHKFTREDFNRNAELFTTGCDANGYEWEYLRRGQSDCALDQGNDCLGCLGGCHRDSKQSSLVTGIQQVEGKGLDVKAEFMVEHIEETQDGYRINGTHQGEKTQLEAPSVILAAGSFGTNKIMLRSGFKKELPALGQGFTCHPQFMSYAIYDEPVDAHKGAFQTVASKDPTFRKKGFKLENVFAPPISTAMLFDVTGAAHQERMRNYRYMSCAEVAVRDEAVGAIDVDKKGELQVTKDLTFPDIERRDAGLEAVYNILSESGAREIVQSTSYFGLHLMGGCSFGTNPAESVINPEFQVHGKKGLYIADSATFPSAPGINPSLTIMALAQRLSGELVSSK